MTTTTAISPFQLIKTALSTALPISKIPEQDLPGEMKRLEKMQAEALVLPTDEATDAEVPAMKAVITIRLNLVKGALTRLNLRAKRNGEDKRKR
jgi:hypothetical protein